MEVGLFGGSFNPPHLAHLIVAEAVREQFGLDEVWWMPAHTPPHKPGAAMASPAHRLEMARLATRSNPAFRVRDDEVARGGISYTVETLRLLQKRHPGAAFSLILGSDSLAGFASWHRPGEIVERAALLVYRRPGGSADGKAEGSVPALAPRFARRLRVAEAPLLEISGTALRARRRQGRSLRYLVPGAVRAYIAEHGLYRTSEPQPSELETS